MPKVNIEKDTNLSANDAFEQVKSLLESDPDLKKLDSSYKCQFDSNSLTGSAKGSKFDAQLRVCDQGSGSRVTISVDLPLLLGAFKGTIKSTLEKKLEKLNI